MINRAATIYDVAKKAGVSPSTVSRVLNEPSKVAAEKRDAVKKAVTELQFIPKAAAVANARKLYHKIGVIAPFFTEPSYMQRLRGISSVLTGLHYELVIYAIDEITDLDTYLEMLVTSNRVDGLIALCMKFDEEEKLILKKANFPVCLVEDDSEGFDSVIVKNLEGGQEAAEFLYRKGYRNPGFIGEKTSRAYAIPATEERLTGFSFFFANQGIIIPKNHTWIGEFSEKKLDEGIRNFLQQENLPDCIFCSSDIIAARVITIAGEYNLTVPDTIAVLGFDDIDVSRYMGLSSVNQNLDESGKIAAELILGHIKDPARVARKMVVPLSICERATTGRG